MHTYLSKMKCWSCLPGAIASSCRAQLQVLRLAALPAPIVIHFSGLVCLVGKGRNVGWRSVFYLFFWAVLRFDRFTYALSRKRDLGIFPLLLTSKYCQSFPIPALLDPRWLPMLRILP